MNKVVETNAVEKLFFDGMTLMVGGFMGCGTPEMLIDLIIETGVRDITLIATDTARVDKGCGRLIKEKRVRKLYASHIGLNPETGHQMNEGIIEVELVPQGTLVECIRAGGFGLGGVLTQTGLGTLVQNGKQIIAIDGKDFILEKPIKADIAIIKGSIVDFYGNTIYRGTTKNFNQMMATAADIVIVEAEKIVSTGSLAKENISTPSVFVDYVIRGGGKNVY